MQKTMQMGNDMNSFLQKTSQNMSKTFVADQSDKLGQTQVIKTTPSFEGKDVGSSERLIHSISMIKDILLSNMQLREEQLKLAEIHDETIQ